MNSLEFIEKEIEQNKILLERCTNHLLVFPSSIIKNRWEEIREKLTYLQQIKAELEAWEVVKDNLWVAEHMQENLNIITMYEINKSINKKEFEILKKALEVEDER